GEETGESYRQLPPSYKVPARRVHAADGGTPRPYRGLLPLPYRVCILGNTPTPRRIPMSVKLGLLALLDEGDMYGYQLRTTFEQRTGATWPLNIGQVYTTLNRLERDGLVEETGDDGEGHQTYRITPAGREEVRRWFVTPVSRSAAPRDELAIKL